MSYKPFMKKSIWVILVAFVASCTPTKIVVPLEEGQVQVGATLGRPKINSGSLPLLGMYAAKGLSENTTAYGAAQLVRRCLEPCSSMEVWLKAFDLLKVLLLALVTAMEVMYS
jgi:hypothetical protein